MVHGVARGVCVVSGVWVLALAMTSAAAAQTVGRAAEVPTLTEGPTVDRDGNLYFTELRFRRIFKVDAKGELSVFRENSHGANGLLVDRRAPDRLRRRRRQSAAITRTDLQTGAVEVLADSYQVCLKAPMT
jgi:gluconolactonase